MANVLVTGGSGLIGWCATEQLVRAGHRVIVFDKQPNLDNLAGVADEIEVVAGDITDLPQLMLTMSANEIDHVLHLAAYITHESNSDPAGAFRVNTIGAANIFDAASALGVRRVCWASSVAVISANVDGSAMSEKVVYAPNTPYGLSKYATEVMAESYATLRGLDVVAVRPPLAFGYGRLTGGTGLFNDAVRRVAQGLPATIAPYHCQFIYNKDMARLFVSALLTEGKLPQRVYNTPSGQVYGPDEIADLMRELCPGAEIAVAPADPALPPEADSRVLVMDGSAATNDLGFAPTYTMHEALAEMLHLYSSEPAPTGARP